MKHKFQFTFNNIERQYEKAIDNGYTFLSCYDYYKYKSKLPFHTIVNRIDIDYSIKKANRLRQIFNRLKIKGTFFVRLHAPEYNPFSFENYRILKALQEDGHEIGYHSEIVDQSVIWDENAVDCLKRDIDVLERMLQINIKGVASHGGMTGLNNLKFWDNFKPSDFNLKYEAYDKSLKYNLFMNSFYISDSEWFQWKSYNNGKLNKGDRRSFGEHLYDEHKLIYLLIHSDTYFDNHFYE
jgi:hypothetical protein